MKKYVYGRFSSDDVPQVERNEFHTLSFFFGLYLDYKENKADNQSFDEYLTAQSIILTDLKWKYINKAHRLIRDKLKEEAEEYGVSRRQIRKLGYSGFGSVLMYPVSGMIIQRMFFMVCADAEDKIWVDKFISTLYQKWMRNYPDHLYLQRNAGEDALSNVCRLFIAFQYRLLRDRHKEEMFEELYNTGIESYEKLHNKLEELEANENV